MRKIIKIIWVIIVYFGFRAYEAKSDYEDPDFYFLAPGPDDLASSPTGL